MTWPFSSRVKLEAQVALLQARLRDAEAQLADQREQTRYFRDRYERVADQMLMRHGEALGPVHVESKPSAGDTLGGRVMRAATLAGNPNGVKFGRSERSGAELPIELVPTAPR